MATDFMVAFKAVVTEVQNVEAMLERRADGGVVLDAVGKAQVAVDAAQVALEEEDSPHLIKEYTVKIAEKKALLLSLRTRAKQLTNEQTMQKAKAQQEERSKLLAGSSSKRSDEDGEPVSNARREMLDQASLINKSKDVTASWKRTRQLLSQELERMAMAEQVLENDAKLIQSTSDFHDTYRTSATKSNTVLKDIQREEKIDRIVVMACFSVFILIVAYIVYKRTIGWII